MLQPKKIRDYNGPTGAYAVLDSRIVSMTSPGGFIALTDAALLTGLGSSDKAAEYADIAQAHGAVTSR